MSELNNVNERIDVTDGQQNKTNSGAVIGIVVGAVAAVFVVLVLVVIGGLVFVVKLLPEIEAINDSKTAYANGERLYREGDYLGAINEYQKVIPKDKTNYSNVPSRISECDQGLNSFLVGGWVYEYPLSEAGGFDEIQNDLKDMGIEYTVPADLKIKCILEFKADGKIETSVDKESADEAIDALLGVIEAVFYQSMYEEGLSESEAKFAMSLVFGTDDIKEVFKQEMDMDSSNITIMDGAPSEFIFSNGVLYFDGNEIEYNFDGDTVILDSESSDAFLENDAGKIDYPIELERE